MDSFISSISIKNLLCTTWALDVRHWGYSRKGGKKGTDRRCLGCRGRQRATGEIINKYELEIHMLANKHLITNCDSRQEAKKPGDVSGWLGGADRWFRSGAQAGLSGRWDLARKLQTVEGPLPGRGERTLPHTDRPPPWKSPMQDKGHT